MNLKALAELFQKRGKLFKRLEMVDLKKLGIKKRLLCFKGVDLNSNYYIFIISKAKSKFVSKDCDKLENIYNILTNHFDHNFKYKYLLLSSSICSKCKLRLNSNKWSVIFDTF